MGLVTGFQTRDNARITWVGGVHLFSDDYANKPLPSCAKTPVPPFPLQKLTKFCFAAAINLETHSSRVM